MRALEEDNLEIATYLLNQTKTDCSILDEEGNNVFHYMSEGEECVSLISELVKKGANINLINNEGASPLFLAMGEKNILLMKGLIDSGADVNLKNEDGVNAIIVALEEEDVNAIKILLMHGANINDKDGDGSPISFLASGDCLGLMLDNKLDVTATNSSGSVLLQELIENYLFVINETSLDDIKMYVDKGYEIPKTLGSKSTLKFISEYEFEIPSNIKIDEETKKRLEEKFKSNKEELTKYLKSKGVK